MFYLENLIWLCLKEIFENPGVAKEITLSLRPQPGGAAVIFSPVDAPATDDSTILLLDYLKATQFADQQNRELLITLPVDLTSC